MVEQHSDELAKSLVERIEHSSRTPDYQKVPRDEFRRAATAIYCHLGDWLLSKTESEIEFHYTQLGARRAQEGIALSNFVWALVITRENLWHFLQTHAMVDRLLELHAELDFIQLVDQFFDRALYYATVGYEQYEREHPAAPQKKKAA